MQETHTVQHFLLKWANRRQIITWALIAIAFFFAVTSSLTEAYIAYVDHSSFMDTLDRLFNVNAAGGLVEYYDVGVMATNIILCIALALSDKHQLLWHRYYLAFMGAGFFFLLIGKSTRIIQNLEHQIMDKFSEEKYLLFVILVIFAVIFIPLAIIVIRNGVRFFLSLPGTTKKWFIWGTIVFGTGAIILEHLSAVIFRTTHSSNLTYEYVSSVEEFMEMAGLVLLHYALLDYLWFSQSNTNPNYPISVSDNRTN